MNFADLPFEELIMTWGLKLVAALLILIIGNWLAKKMAALFVKVMNRNEIDVTLTKFLRNIIYYALLTAVVIAAAGQLGINTTSFLTVVGAAGLAIGLALKDSLANFSAGVMLILFRPFKVGDAITVAGETGAVEEITIFNTVINTPDNQRKIIPNESSPVAPLPISPPMTPGGSTWYSASATTTTSRRPTGS